MADVNREQTEALNPQTAKKTLDIDALQQEVGQFGLFQVRNILLSLIVVVFLGWSNNLYVFTTARIPTRWDNETSMLDMDKTLINQSCLVNYLDFRCHIPECDPEEPEFTPNWLLNAVPGTSLGSFDNCQRFGNATAVPLESDVCPATRFDRNQLKSCERHLYQNTNSVVYDVRYFRNQQ